MNYELFQLKLADEVRRLIGQEVRVETQNVRKNNGVQYHAISFISKKERISPVLYLDGYYERYREGVPIAHLAKIILAQYLENRSPFNQSFDFFSDYEQVKDRIFCKVINFEKNRFMLQTVPYRKLLDLAIVCYYLVDETLIPGAAIQITDQHRKVWGITEDDLFARAIANTTEEEQMELIPITDLIESLLEGQELEDVRKMNQEFGEQIPMYIVTNRRRCMGAILSLLPGFLKQIAQILKDDFYILPSSINECIVVPKALAMPPEEMQEMVENINDIEVEPQEVLSDHVYLYDREMSCITMMA